MQISTCCCCCKTHWHGGMDHEERRGIAAQLIDDNLLSVFCVPIYFNDFYSRTTAFDDGILIQAAREVRMAATTALMEVAKSATMPLRHELVTTYSHGLAFCLAATPVAGSIASANAG